MIFVDDMMKRFSTDIAWPIINLAKEKFKITLVKDNMADRGPLRTIPNNLYQKDMYKWNYTSSMDPKVKASLKTKEFPVSSPEYGVDTFYNFNKYMKDERGDWLKDCGWDFRVEEEAKSAAEKWTRAEKVRNH